MAFWTGFIVCLIFINIIAELFGTNEYKGLIDRRAEYKIKRDKAIDKILDEEKSVS